MIRLSATKSWTLFGVALVLTISLSSAAALGGGGGGDPCTHCRNYCERMKKKTSMKEMVLCDNRGVTWKNNCDFFYAQCKALAEGRLLMITGEGECSIPIDDLGGVGSVGGVDNVENIGKIGSFAKEHGLDATMPSIGNIDNINQVNQVKVGTLSPIGKLNDLDHVDSVDEVDAVPTVPNRRPPIPTPKKPRTPRPVERKPATINPPLGTLLPQNKDATEAAPQNGKQPPTPLPTS